MVAEVMIAKDKLLQGIASEAKLYASAVGSLNEGGQAQECLATQHIAQQNSGDISGNLTKNDGKAFPPF